MIVKEGERYIDKSTGEVLSAKEWIINEFEGRITKVKRLSDKQLAYIESMEYQLGYKPRSHANMPAYKAAAYIEKLQLRVKQLKLF